MRAFLSVVFLLWTILVSKAQGTADHQIDDGTVFSHERVESSGDEQGLAEEERDRLRRDPISINEADRDQLEELGLLSPFQIEQLLNYRRTMGHLLDKYEMQAIPGWDVQTIRAIFPYVTIRNSTSVFNGKSTLAGKGGHRILFRVGTNNLFPNLSVAEAYAGDRFSSVIRYQYQSRIVSYGFTGSKDPGEPWRQGKHFLPFDFRSPYFLYTSNGSVRRLVAGDFTVQLGQGLVQWQRLSFGKSGELSGIKRQGEALQPYRSSGSFYFYRGAGLSIAHRKHQWILFLSRRRLDAQLIEDSLNRNAIYVTSIIRSGYHRTMAEQHNRDRLVFLSAGGQWKVNVSNGHLALNVVHHYFGYPLSPTDAPYNHYDIRGSRWTNYSMDHSITFQNLHWFNEVACSQNGSLAWSTGILVSLDARFALGLLIRDWSPGYQAFYSGGFGEGSSVNNERGVYTSVFFRPVKAVKVEGYMDIFQVPWLTYSFSQPAIGFDQMLRFTYIVDRHRTFYVQLRSRSRYKDENAEQWPLDTVIDIRAVQCRVHAEGILSPGWEMRVRMETVKILGGSKAQAGWLGYLDLRHRFSRFNIELQARVQYHSTDAYASRIYAYEPDVSYAGRTRFFYGQAFRWCLNGAFPIFRDRDLKMKMWMRISRSISVSEDRNYLNINSKKIFFPIEFQSQLQFQF